jgi:hypothetical protein
MMTNSSRVSSVSGFDRGFNGALLEQTKDRQCEERTEQKDQ